jgi:hypothetical protein
VNLIFDRIKESLKLSKNLSRPSLNLIQLVVQDHQQQFGGQKEAFDKFKNPAAAAGAVYFDSESNRNCYYGGNRRDRITYTNIVKELFMR